MVLLHNPRAQTGSDITSTISEPLLDGGEQQQAKHGEGVEASGGAELGSDPYDPQEEDPAKTRAVESSLWELQALRNHYCPQVGFEDIVDSVEAAGAEESLLPSDRLYGLLVPT
eukprot:1142239-Pelagomonas_calceolata.AAC.2